MNLKECPFCGSDAIIIYEIEDEDLNIWYKAHCLNCHVRTNGYASKEDAEAAWNRRITDTLKYINWR